MTRDEARAYARRLEHTESSGASSTWMTAIILLCFCCLFLAATSALVHRIIQLRGSCA